MVMLSDSESNAKQAMPVAVDDTDSLLMFSSESTANEGSDEAQHQVQVAIVDNRATREAIWRLEGYRALHESSARIDARLVEVERAVHRIERSIANEVLEERAAIQELHTDIDRRLAHVEEVLLRLGERNTGRERNALGPQDSSQVLTETEVWLEPSPWLVPPRWQRRVKSLAAGGVLVGVSILVMMIRIPVTGGAPPVARLVDRELQARDALAEAPNPFAPVPTSPLPRPRAPVSTRRAVVPTQTEGVAARRFVGDLSIASTPSGARVFINGRGVGVTPLVLHERQAGSLAVQIARDGFERWSASVQVRAGQMTNVAAALRPAR